MIEVALALGAVKLFGDAIKPPKVMGITKSSKEYIQSHEGIESPDVDGTLSHRMQKEMRRWL